MNYDCVFVVSDTGVQMNARIGQLSSRSLRGHLAAAQFDFDGVVEGWKIVNDLLWKFKSRKLGRKGYNSFRRQAKLAEKVFGVVMLGLELASTRAEDEESKKQTKNGKLLVEDGLIQLPSPQELKTGREVWSKNFPDKTEENVEEYLADS